MIERINSGDEEIRVNFINYDLRSVADKDIYFNNFKSSVNISKLTFDM